MLAEIEQAIHARVEQAFTAQAARIKVRRGMDDIRQPGIYVAAESGAFTRVGQRWKQTAIIWVDIIFSELSSEAARREGATRIMEGVAMLLMDFVPVPQAEALKMESWEMIRDEELRKIGLAVCSLKLATAWMVVADEDTADVLFRIGLNYYLQPDDGVADAADLLTLREENNES